jgi:hypothetical protein
VAQSHIPEQQITPGIQLPSGTISHPRTAVPSVTAATQTATLNATKHLHLHLHFITNKPKGNV